MPDWPRPPRPIVRNLAPGAAETTIYTVPASVLGADNIYIHVANGSASNSRTFRVYVTPSGGSKRYLDAGTTLAATTSTGYGLTALGPGDVVGCYGSASDVEFTLTAIEY